MAGAGAYSCDAWDHLQWSLLYLCKSISAVLWSHPHWYSYYSVLQVLFILYATCRIVTLCSSTLPLSITNYGGPQVYYPNILRSCANLPYAVPPSQAFGFSLIAQTRAPPLLPCSLPNPCCQPIATLIPPLLLSTDGHPCPIPTDSPLLVQGLLWLIMTNYYHWFIP